MVQGNLRVIFSHNSTIRIYINARTVLIHSSHPAEQLTSYNGHINVLSVADCLHIEEVLGVDEKILNCFHLLGDVEFLEDVAVSEETDVQILEKAVHRICLGLCGVGNEVGLDVNYTVEVVTKDMGNTTDNKQKDHRSDNTKVEEPQQTPSTIDHFFACEQIEYMRRYHSYLSS